VAAWIPSLALAAHLVPARQLERREKRARLPSGVGPLDALIGGGWPKGALSELAGGRSTGRTALLLASLAEALRRGEAAALVDVGGTLDPRAAMRGGVALPRLLWIRCCGIASGAGELRSSQAIDVDKALAAAEIVLAAGGFGLVALDLGEPRTGARIATPVWMRLKRAAEQQGTAVLVTSARRMQGALGACAVTLSQARPKFVGVDAPGPPPLLVGLDARAEVERGADEQQPPRRLSFSHEE
jgi:RecA/RadA recombinase